MLQKVCTLILLTFIFGGHSVSAQVVAIVGKEKITLKEFKQKLNSVRDSVINPPRPEQYLEDRIRMAIGVQEAQKNNLSKKPEVKEQLRQVLYKAYVEEMIGDETEKIKVTEKEMKAYYSKNPEVRLSHILIEFTPDASAKEIAKARKRARQIYKEVKKSKRPFEELVRLYTDDSMSKSTGGDIGYQSRVTVVPTIYETARRMDVGDIRGPVRTRYGFHILKLTGKHSYSQADKRQIRAAVYDKKRAQLFDRLFAKLKKKYKIRINEKLLKKIK